MKKRYRYILLVSFWVVSIVTYAQEVKIYYLTDSAMVSVKIYEMDDMTNTNFYYINEPLGKDTVIKFYKTKEKKILLLETKFVNDTIYVFQYFENGNKKFLTKEFKEMLVSEKAWCLNGTIIRDVDMSEIPYHVTNYYCNGYKKNDFNLGKPFYVGDYQSWYSNGKLEKEGTYDSKGNKNYIWKYYDKNGNKIKEENWDFGKLIETNGTLVHDETVKNDLYLIKPGKGYGSIELGGESLKDISEKYGKGEVEKSTLKREKTTLKKVSVTYKELDIQFEFYNKGKSKSDLYSIWFRKQSLAKTIDGITIGESTTKDVVSIYGSPDFIEAQTYVYNDYGISFTFEREKVITIRIFEKKKV